MIDQALGLTEADYAEFARVREARARLYIRVACPACGRHTQDAVRKSSDPLNAVRCEALCPNCVPHDATVYEEVFFDAVGRAIIYRKEP